MGTVSSRSTFFTTIAAAVLACGLVSSLGGAAVAQIDARRRPTAVMRWSPAGDAVVRLDTRTGAVSTCTNSSAGLGLLRRARRTRGDGTRKSVGCRPTMRD